MDLVWKNVTLDYKKSKKEAKIGIQYKRALDNVSGYAKKGKITGIIGPSGAGKTSLINTLIGLIPESSKTHGHITIDGQERTIENWVGKYGYVTQNTYYFKKLTVYEAIKRSFSFRKLGEKIENYEQEIFQILKLLYIEDLIHQKISSLSGGQFKRVMIATELIIKSAVIFLDEPTSGLDSVNAIEMIRVLKDFANKNNITMVVTIHQAPIEAFNLLDDLILLKESSIVFSGPRNECKHYFDSYGLVDTSEGTFADFTIKVISNKENISAYESATKEMIKKNKNGVTIPENEISVKPNLVYNADFSFKRIFLFILQYLKHTETVKYRISRVLCIIISILAPPFCLKAYLRSNSNENLFISILKINRMKAVAALIYCSMCLSYGYRILDNFKYLKTNETIFKNEVSLGCYSHNFVVFCLVLWLYIIGFICCLLTVIFFDFSFGIYSYLRSIYFVLFFPLIVVLNSIFWHSLSLKSRFITILSHFFQVLNSISIFSLQDVLFFILIPVFWLFNASNMVIHLYKRDLFIFFLNILMFLLFLPFPYLLFSFSMFNLSAYTGKKEFFYIYDALYSPYGSYFYITKYNHLHFIVSVFLILFMSVWIVFATCKAFKRFFNVSFRLKL